jgi:hypothetical protein
MSRTAFRCPVVVEAGIGGSATVVVDQVLAEHQPHVPVAEDQVLASSSRRRVPMTRSQTRSSAGSAAGS